MKPSALPSAAIMILCLAGHARGQFQPTQTVQYPGEQLIEVTVRTSRELLAVQNIASDVWNCTPAVGVPLLVQVTPEQKTAIESLGLPVVLKHESVDALIAGHLALVRGSRLARDNSWFQTYHNLAEFNTFMDGLVAANPTLVTSFIAGNSLESRPIRGLRVTAPDQPGNPRSARPAVLLIGGQHAREWANHAATIFFAHSLLEQYPTSSRIRDLLGKVEIIVIPVANPDGYEFTWNTTRLWRKNRRDNGDGSRGVDLNRNWGYAWGSNNGSSGTPASDIYRGTAPFSEPETAALRDFTIANTRIAAAIDVHSFSQLILSPWGSTPTLPTNAGYFDQINLAWSNAIFSVNGLFYRPGPTYTNIYPVSGGSTDWFFGDRNILAWGIEVRDTGQFGFLLPPDQILPTALENFAGFLTVADAVVAPLKLYIPGPLPAWIPTSGPTVATVVAESNTLPLDPASVRVFSRVGSGAFTSTIMAANGNLYSAAIPTPPCGQRVEFYFEAVTAPGAGTARTAREPVAGVYSLRSADTLIAANFDGETAADFGLSAPADTATAGGWERGVPQGTNFQSGSDSDDPGANGWFTGLAAGASANANDVDGGFTTLTTAIMNTRPPEGRVAIDTQLSYATWFGTNASATTGPDSLAISYSPDDGANWQSVQTFSSDARAWTKSSFAIPSSVRSRVRFVATDGGGASTTEAAVDAVRVTIRHCRRSADVTGDAGVGIEDLLRYLELFDAGVAEADYSNDEGVGIDDLLIYLQTYEDGY